MSLEALLALTLFGFAVGFLAGLVGIGGGVLMVPFLYFFYAHAGWSGVHVPPDLQATVAHATSLFVIVPTAVVGTATYARHQLVAWRVVWPVAIFSMVAATIGAILATRSPQELLKVAFGTFLLFSALQLVRERGRGAPGPMRSSSVLAALTGLLVGVFSALLGVGGGLVAIPLLLYVIRLNIERVAATSLAIVAFAATAGVITYMSSGVDGLPSGHVGFVHMFAALPMLPGAMLAARWGARVNQRTDPRRLRMAFALVFAAIGMRLIVVNLGALV